MADQITALDDEVKELRKSTGITGKVVSVIALVYAALEIAGLQFVTIDQWVFMTLVLILVLILGYIRIPFSPKDKGKVMSGLALYGVGLSSLFLPSD